MQGQQATEVIGRDGLPFYLVEHYSHAYLSPLGVRVFDRQFVINAILFGQYRNLMRATLEFLGDQIPEPALQLTCVYGELSQALLRRIRHGGLHLTDVAPVQLDLVRRKNRSAPGLITTRMNVENLGYRQDTFQAVVIFFLLHELPPGARQRTLAEVLLVMTPGARLVVADYAARPQRHPLYRLGPSRRLLQRLEPYLAGFWEEDLDALIACAASRCGKTVARHRQENGFRDFYRVVEYRVGQHQVGGPPVCGELHQTPK